MDAKTATDDAQTAATAAQTAADAAETARANRAAIQTGDFHAGNSGELADKAQEHATAAQDAADDAKTAADATELSSATRALVMAENSKTAAEKQQMYAETARDNAMTAAEGEISIVDKTKTVDGTSITIDEVTHTSTINDVTKMTGLLKGLKITTAGAMIVGKVAVPNNADTPADEAADAIPGAAMRALDIGFTYDSGDDSARVTLVHSYAGTQTVTAFAADNIRQPRMGSAGKIDQDGIDDADTSPDLALTKASGTFLAATTLEFDGSIATATEAVDLYYFTDPVDDAKKYVREASSITDEDTGVTTYTYAPVSIRAGAKVPDAAEYSHLHFGVWAGLSGDDANEITDLGIGFVANIGEMTSNMPNFGSADYEGNWVAKVQEMDGEGDGDIMRRDGTATMNADFGKGEVGVMRMGLASLEGAIDGNTFSGTKATLAATGDAADMLDEDAKFEGNFSGAFFGNLAAEAGGVFDFASDDDSDGKNEGGAFRGAFGADQKPPPAE